MNSLQIAALDVFEGHVVDAVGFADGVDLHDVGVRGLGDGLGFLLEALQSGGVGGQIGRAGSSGRLCV